MAEETRGGTKQQWGRLQHAPLTRSLTPLTSSLSFPLVNAFPPPRAFASTESDRTRQRRAAAQGGRGWGRKADLDAPRTAHSLASAHRTTKTRKRNREKVVRQRGEMTGEYISAKGNKKAQSARFITNKHTNTSKHTYTQTHASIRVSVLSLDERSGSYTSNTEKSRGNRSGDVESATRSCFSVRTSVSVFSSFSFLVGVVPLAGLQSHASLNSLPNPPPSLSRFSGTQRTGAKPCESLRGASQRGTTVLRKGTHTHTHKHTSTLDCGSRNLLRSLCFKKRRGRARSETRREQETDT